MNTLPNIMLVGIQGSGKGTQARKLVEKFGYQLFDTGAELRKISQQESEFWKKVKNLIENWKYVPSEYIRDIILHFVDSNKNHPILFDSPIRSNEQDSVIRPILGKPIVIELVLDSDTATKRLLERRIDPETGETFPTDFHGNINPKTGNTLTTRKDDNQEAITSRIKWSMEETLPLIDQWEKDGFIIHKINAHQDIETIFKKISQIITQ